ncbi:MAG: hypothetical protein ABIG89_03645 [Candidatus Woesearchaeota archaeon]
MKESKYISLRYKIMGLWGIFKWGCILYTVYSMGTCANDAISREPKPVTTGPETIESKFDGDNHDQGLGSALLESMKRTTEEYLRRKADEKMNELKQQYEKHMHDFKSDYLDSYYD